MFSINLIGLLLLVLLLLLLLSDKFIFLLLISKKKPSINNYLYYIFKLFIKELLLIHYMELIISENDKNFPNLCLNMIVKNESHIIYDTLKKLLDKIKFDYWIISDTGSTDNTIDIIKHFFYEHKINGELFCDEWIDFGHNRTKALEHAYKKSNYILIFDADDEIIGDFILPDLSKDSYLFQFGDPNGTSYIRTQIVNNMKKWKYVGVLHEVIISLEDSYSSEIIKGNYYTVSGRTSSRNKEENKYLKDAQILEKAYEKCFEINDGLYNRYGYYCANSYFDCGKWEDAIKWYKITLNNNNWTQEKYLCCLKIYECYNRLNNKENGFFYLLKAFEYDKERVECLYELIVHYCVNNQNDLAYKFFALVKDFYNEKYLIQGYNDKLFLDISKPNFYFPYYMILVADRVQDFDTVIKMYIIIFTKKFYITNTFYVGNMLYNLQFFIDRVKDNEYFLNLFKQYVVFLKSINYPLYNHDFMISYEKYGITGIFDVLNPKFSQDECKNSKNILFYTGYSNVKWNYTYSQLNALGGSESAVINLTNNFPKYYNIYISGDIEEECYDNIKFVNLNNLKNIIETKPFHTIIVSRYLNFYELYPNFSAYQTFIWAHDIVLFSYGTNLSVENILTKWNSSIKGCICQTEWHKSLFLSIYPQLNEKIHVINNGIDTKMITNKITKNNKFKNRFIYTSCSERGLDRLIELWPKILEKFADAELYISSYNLFPKNELDSKIKINMDKYPSVKHVGRLSKQELYGLMLSSEYWLYPTEFNETSCITSMEMLMCEVICIYYPRAGLINTLGDYGIKVERENEIETIINLSDEDKNIIKKRGREYALSCDWFKRMIKWCELININYIKNNIKVINLKRREDRKNEMIKQFERENIDGYEFFEAIDGLELKETKELKLLFECNNFNYQKGIIGCALSHISLWHSLLNDNNNDYYVVLEDDLELISGFKEKLEKHCKIFREMMLEHLSLGVSKCNEEQQKKISTDDIKVFEKDVYKFWNITFAYIISKNAAQKMLSFINKCSVKCAIDNPHSYGEIIKYYHTTQCIAKQRNVNEFGTDIQNNYNYFNFNSNLYSNKLKIAYCDWWHIEYCGGNFDFNNNFIINILRKYGNVNYIEVVEPYENPDILFYSIFGDKHLNYPNIRRVFYSGEPFGIRKEANFNFTFDPNSDLNIRFPLWLGYLNDYLLEECTRRKNGIINIPKRERFCSFISNGEIKTTHRKSIVEKLSKYKKVHCGGKYLNNIGYTVPRGINCSGKIEHNNNYKFAIAFENEDYHGYVTEKICDIYKSNCIPIYWGTKEVVKDFNPSTFINASDFKDFDTLVDYIIKVDNDDELYASYFKEPIFSNKWLDVFNDPNKIFYKNLSDCIIGKNNNLYSNYILTLDKIENINDINVKIFNIWHNKLFDKCYEKLDSYSLNNIIMYDVNPKYNKIYNKDKNYIIKKEYELDVYDETFQEYNYCQTSCLYHVFVNKLYEDLDYIGFIQYDMVLGKDFFYNIKDAIVSNDKNTDIYFYSLVVKNKIDVKFICEPYENSILEKYNTYFNTNHTYMSIYNDKKSCMFICLHTFVIPTKTFFKMMSWYSSIHNWLHKKYLENLYQESISEITEEIFGLFLLLQTIENDNITFKQLNLNHEWPQLHNETEWNNYKVKIPDNLKRLNYVSQIKNNYDNECNRISDINEHLPILYEYAKDCESIIECGVRGCVSSWAFAIGLIDNNKNIKKLFLNDIDKCDINMFLELTKNTELNIGYKWCSDLDLLIEENVDMVFIDTFHVYGQLKRELEKFSKITNKYIILHDTSIDEINGECVRCGWNAEELSLKTGIPKEEITKGLGLAIHEFLDTNDDWTLHKKYNNNNGLTILKKTIKLGKLCFDIGANIGNWSKQNSSKYNKIIAVEASENIFNELVANISNDRNICPLNFAVCDVCEEFIKFYECESHTLSTINKKWLNGGISRFEEKYKEVICKTISIDKLIEIYGIPDLIKIDVESAEYLCIKSLTKKVNNLCFEWASEFLDITLNCLNYLYKLGFKHFYLQMNNDEYTFTPINYYNITIIKEQLINTRPKIDWGMIWCK